VHTTNHTATTQQNIAKYRTYLYRPGMQVWHERALVNCVPPPQLLTRSTSCTVGVNTISCTSSAAVVVLPVPPVVPVVPSTYTLQSKATLYVWLGWGVARTIKSWNWMRPLMATPSFPVKYNG
jgi:hypothetical protein